MVEGPSEEVDGENRSEVSAQLADGLDARVVVVLGYFALQIRTLDFVLFY